MKTIKVMAVFGTRPEAVKMCPLVLELGRREEIACTVVLTGQHREMLHQVMDIFCLKAKHDLDLMRPGQSLGEITAAVLQGMQAVLEREAPDLVLVHGDTTTALAAALAAFYQKIPVGHVEAGLRTFDRDSPFPEEINRVLLARLATLHFSPTLTNRQNLKAEGIEENVFITGNTVIDALATTIKERYQYKSQALKALSFTHKKTILMTAHRRENWGAPLVDICLGAKRIAQAFQEVQIIYPVHPNPTVRKTVFAQLDGIENVHLIDPIDVEDMHNLMSHSFLVLTDSGGLQEEAPSCGVPVLVLRRETERPEAVAAGTVKLIGTDQETIYQSTKKLLEDPAAYAKMARAVNPYGDGHASERIAAAILQWDKNKK